MNVNNRPKPIEEMVTDLEIFPEGDHRFSNSQHRLRAIKMSFEWFQKYL